MFEDQPTVYDDAETAMYKKAVQVVAESQRRPPPTSSASSASATTMRRLIERMEKDGKVSVPDHVGRREVLIDTDGHAI